MNTETTSQQQNVVDLSSPLTIYNATEAALAEIKDKYQGLTITGVDDKDGYKAVAEGLRIVVALRNKVDKRRQELKRHIDNGSKTILNALAPVETALRLQKDRIDNELERIKQEKAEAARLAFVARTQQLFDLGFSFNGTIYTLGTLVYIPATIKDLTDEQWSKEIEVATLYAADLKAKREAEEAEIARLKEANERLRRELEASNTVQTNLDTIKAQGAIVEGKVTSATAGPDGVTVEADVKLARPAVSVSIPVRFEDEVTTQDGDGAPAPQAPKQEPSYADTIYLQGFNECRSRILTILSNPEPITRKGLIDTITNLKP